MDRYRPSERDHLIRLVLPEEITLRRGEDVFRCSYVHDCIREDKLLPNLIEYRVNRNSIFADYDPFDVLVGRKKWIDIEYLGTKVSGDEFDIMERAARVTQMSQKFKEYRTRLSYTDQEEREIYKFLKANAYYKRTAGNYIWKKMEQSGVCNGKR